MRFGCPIVALPIPLKAAGPHPAPPAGTSGVVSRPYGRSSRPGHSQEIESPGNPRAVHINSPSLDTRRRAQPEEGDCVACARRDSDDADAALLQGRSNRERPNRLGDDDDRRLGRGLRRAAGLRPLLPEPAGRPRRCCARTRGPAMFASCSTSVIAIIRKWPYERAKSLAGGSKHTTWLSGRGLQSWQHFWP